MTGRGTQVLEVTKEQVRRGSATSEYGTVEGGPSRSGPPTGQERERVVHMTLGHRRVPGTGSSDSPNTHTPYAIPGRPVRNKDPLVTRGTIKRTILFLGSRFRSHVGAKERS